MNNKIFDPLNLCEIVERIINENTENLKFKVFYYLENLDKTWEITEEKKLETFFPVYIGNISGQFRPISTDISENSFPVQILFEANNKDKIFKCFNELKTKILGRVINQNDYSYVFNFSVPQINKILPADLKVLAANERRFSIKQENMAVMSFNIQTLAADFRNTVFGNQLKYSIIIKDDDNNDYEEEIIKINSAFANNISMKPAQFMSEKTSVSIGEANAKANTLSFFDNPSSYLCNKLISLAESGEIQNYKLKIKKNYLNNAGQLRFVNGSQFEFVEEVYITSFQYSSPLGDLASIVLNYVKANG